MKDNKSGWQFPKALEIIKCKEGNKEFMKERPARRPFGNTALICEYPIDDTAADYQEGERHGDTIQGMPALRRTS